MREGIQEILDKCLELGLVAAIWEPTKTGDSAMHFANPFSESIITNGRVRWADESSPLIMPDTGESVDTMLDIVLGIDPKSMRETMNAGQS